MGTEERFSFAITMAAVRLDDGYEQIITPGEIIFRRLPGATSSGPLNFAVTTAVMVFRDENEAQRHGAKLVQDVFPAQAG